MVFQFHADQVSSVTFATTQYCVPPITWIGRAGITWPAAPWSRGKLDARMAEQTAAVETAKGRAQTDCHRNSGKIG